MLGTHFKNQVRGALSPFFVDQNTPFKEEKMNIKKLTRQAVVAAIYVVLTIALAPFGYGPIQFRLSEILAILPFFNSEYILAITVGCFISNIASTVGSVDMIVGTFQTLICAYIMSKMKNLYLACIVPILGMVLIALEIFFMMPNPTGFFVILIELMCSEFIVIYIIGIPIFYILNRNEKIKKLLNFKTTSK